MSPADHNPAQSPALRPAAPADPALDAGEARLTHEFANLLDASLRNLGLAINGLRHLPPDPAIRAREEDGHVHRLETANQGLRQMVGLLQRWRTHCHPADLHQDSHTLGEMIQHAVRLLQPAAAAGQIEIVVCVADAAGRLRAGPVYPILANALRNSIEAFSTLPASPAAGGAGATAAPGAPAPERASRRIEIIAGVNGASMELIVRDDGPGLALHLLDAHGRFRFGATTKPDGHGLGLTFARDLAASLGGELRLENRSPRGTVLTLRYPVGAVADL